MKRLSNILSYLCSLLLLLALTTCSDWEEIVVTMQMEEEVELNIQTEVSGMKGSTRTAPTESIIAITAYAFDSNSQLIKVVKAILSDQAATNGNLKIKVPKRTGDIHFIAKNNAESPDVTINIGDNVSTLLSQTTDDLHYWGKATYNGGNNLSVTLIRNMAKVTLTLNNDLQGHIAGFVNYNQTGTLVPGNFEVGTLNATNDVASHSNGDLGTEHYLFEHANEKNNNPLYAICNIGGKYYKIAFATNNNGELNHFPIVRNHQYNININEIETALGSDRYEDAVAANPINNAVVTEVELSVTAETNELYYNIDRTLTVTANVPEGVSALTITASEFDVTTTSEKVTEKSGYNYTVTSSGEVAFTFTLKDGSYTDGQTVSIQFTGTAEYGYELTNPEAISIILKAQKTVSIVAESSAMTLNYAESSVEDLLVNVTIPKEVTGLTFNSSDFTIKVVGNELTATEGVYTITHDENATKTTIPVRIRLNDEVSAETASFTFGGTSNDANVIVNSDTESIALSAGGDANVRWQGNVPLSYDDYATMVPLLYNWFCESDMANIPINSRLQFEFDVTSDSESYFEITEIRGSSNEWNNPAFSFPELANGYSYDAITSGEGPVIVTMNQGVFDIILENYQSLFLGDTDVAMAIRGAGITLTKVSVLPPAKLLVTAPDATDGVSNASVNINYSNSTAIEEYTIRVAVPDGVTQLNYNTNNGFSKVYIDNENGWYNEVPQTIDTSNNKDIALKLLVNKEYNANPTITFSAANVESATFTVNRTAGEPNANVLWEGALQFQGYGVNVSKIAIPNSLLQGKLLDGAVLTLEYKIVNDADDFISICGSAIESWAQLNDMADDGEYADNNSSTITLKFNPTIIENIGDGAINMQGNGRVLNKVTLTPPVVVQDQDMYEIWVNNNNNAWIGNNDADVAFFGYAGQNFNTGTSNSLESTFYDASADSHKSQAMVMDSDDSFTFTITGTEPRYLTLLVARKDNAPSINLQKDGNTWTTNDTNAFPYANSYNFSGDIGVNGRLICYTLDPGTYTLQRGEADYYLYYMRVSKEKSTTLTDIIQPTIDDYTFYWRGGEFGNYLKINDNNYIVDDDNKEFVITLTDAFRNSHGIASRTLSLNSMSVQIGDNHYTANSTNYVTISNNNAGSYSYTIGQGEIEVGTGNYKFSNFYNKIVLKEPATTQKSGINVKNSVMLKLTNNDSEVDYYTEEMTTPALMICSPLTVPLSEHRQFDFSIVAENGTWTRQGERYKMIQQNGTSYIIVKDGNKQYDEFIHPFNPGYDYFIDWGNFTDGGNVNRSLKSMTISTNDNDVYFSYKWLGIAKSLKIPTRYDASPPTTVNYTLSAWSWENSYYSSETYPVGTRISINFTASGTVKLIAGDGRWLYIPEFSGRYPTDSNDLHMYVSSGLYEFVVGPEIKLRRVQNGMVSEEEFLSGSLSGLRIQGDGPTIESITITTPQQ